MPTIIKMCPKKSIQQSINQTEVKTRLDKWLWAARFYKTRLLATEAINAGHVHLNGQRVKASHLVQVSNELKINKTPFSFEITVLAVSVRRGPAKEAQMLYQESAESLKKRETLAEQRKLNAELYPHVEHRPDKRDRRRIIRFKNINRES